MTGRGDEGGELGTRDFRARNRERFDPDRPVLPGQRAARELDHHRASGAVVAERNEADPLPGVLSARKVDLRLQLMESSA